MKYGIYHYYPRLRRILGEKTVAYIRLTRPFTLLAPCLAGLFGVLTPVNSITLQHVFTAIYVGATLALLQAVGQITNQIIDVDLDAMLPRKKERPIVSGKVSKDEASGIAWLLALFGLSRAFTISIQFGIISITLLASAVYYSFPPFSPRKVHPLVNMGWMAVSRGFLPMLAVWSVAGSLSRALPYSLLAFLWVMGFQGSKDTPDIIGDKKFGIKTVPGVYGLRGLTALMVTCSVVYLITALYFQIYVMLLVLPMATLAVLTTKKQSTLTENTVAWQCFYISLGLIYVLMFINERFYFSPF